MKIIATIEVTIIVEDDDESYENMKRRGVLTANELLKDIPNSKLKKVEEVIGYETREINLNN
jgi:hypothetical protein